MEDFFYAGGLRAPDGRDRRPARSHGARPSAARRSARTLAGAKVYNDEVIRRATVRCRREGGAGGAARQPGARRRRDQAHRRRRRVCSCTRAPPSSSATTTTWRRASTIPRWRSRRTRCSCCATRGRWAARACPSGGCCRSRRSCWSGRARHGADLGRAHERHRLRHLRAARRARVVRRRAAGAASATATSSRWTCRRAGCRLEVADDELAARRPGWTPPRVHIRAATRLLFATRHAGRRGLRLRLPVATARPCPSRRFTDGDADQSVQAAAEGGREARRPVESIRERERHRDRRRRRVRLDSHRHRARAARSGGRRRSASHHRAVGHVCDCPSGLERPGALQTAFSMPAPRRCSCRT